MFFPRKWDQTQMQLHEAKLDAAIAHAREIAGEIAKCSEELTVLANGAMADVKKLHAKK